MVLARPLLVRRLLVTVVGAGVVAMHVLVYLGGCGGGAVAGSSSMSDLVRSPAAALRDMHIEFRGTRSESRGAHVMAGMAGPAAHGGTGPAGPRGPDPQPGDRQPAAGMFGHLCLAVLEVLGALVLLALVLLAAWLRTPGVALAAPWRRRPSSRAPPGRPPSGISLVELCVARR